jgi:poly(3-hydroxybutyrate) depolymerase
LPFAEPGSRKRQSGFGFALDNFQNCPTQENKMKTKLFYAGALALCVSALVACAAPTPAPTPTTASNASAILTATAPQAQTSAPQAQTSALSNLPTPRAVSQATIRVGDLDRSYLYYVPPNLPRNAPLLFALHAYQGVDAQRMRAATAYEFESLADQNGFIVVYPQGYQVSWNTCLQAGTVPAKKQNIDDVGFIRALIAKFRADYGINPSRVFAMGYLSSLGNAV